MPSQLPSYYMRIWSSHFRVLTLINKRTYKGIQKWKSQYLPEEKRKEEDKKKKKIPAVELGQCVQQGYWGVVLENK